VHGAATMFRQDSTLARSSVAHEERTLVFDARPRVPAAVRVALSNRLTSPRLLGPWLVIPAAAAAAATAALQPRTVPIIVGGVVLVWLLASGRRVIALFHGWLGVVLVGYAFLGRGFAYLGAAPVYVGEMALGLAVLAIVFSLGRARFGRLHALLVAFMLWGLVRTVPYIGTYGIDALRDAVLWGYATFAIAVSVTVEAMHLPPLARAYRALIPWLLVWIPVAVLLTTRFANALPHDPGSDVAIVDIKAGDMGVHLAAVGVFILLGLYGRFGRATIQREISLWTGWILGLGLVAALNRGAMAAASATAASLLFVRRSSRWLRLVMVGLLMAGLVALVNPQVELGGSRPVSLGQVVSNFVSVFSSQPDTVNQATKDWRLAWWGKIVSYTIDGPYFWTGKGFGINLADSDGFQVTPDHSLRAPHSVNFDILARTGVPGLILWIALNLSFAASLLRAAVRANRAGRTFWVQVLGWVFVYWLAALVNGSFDVYLEGPQGGIWYWAVMGLGMAAIRLSREEPAPVSVPDGGALAQRQADLPQLAPGPS
jgi:hypothetical protein